MPFRKIISVYSEYQTTYSNASWGKEADILYVKASTTHCSWWLGQHSRYSNMLGAGCPRDQIPLEMRFSVPVQTSPKVHPTSCTTSTRCFIGGNADRHGVDHPPPSSAEAANGLRLNVRLPSVSAYPCHGGDLYLHTQYSKHVEVFRVNATYKSRADIDGGSAMNSNSAGGSLGIKGCSDTCFSNSCCCFCWADDRTVLSCGTGAPPALGSWPV